MEHNNNVLNHEEYIKIGSFVFSSDFRKDELYFEAISKREFSKYAYIDDTLSDIDIFYVLVEDYIYNIVIKYKQGHKLLIRKSKDGNFIDVYSLNDKRLIEQTGVQKVKR